MKTQAAQLGRCSRRQPRRVSSKRGRLSLCGCRGGTAKRWTAGRAVHEMGLDMRQGVIGCVIIILQFAQGCSNPYTIDPSIRIKNGLMWQSPPTQLRRRAVRPSIGIKNGLIAFTLRDRAGMLQIFTENEDGSNQRQLTFEGDNGRPDWSPDGGKIAFGSHRNGNAWVAVMAADGSNQRLLVAGTQGDPDWSPDGNQIALSRPAVSIDGQIRPQIWVMNADGSNLRQVTQTNTFKGGPSWSRDGTQMVFILIKNPGSPTHPQPEIGIMNSDGTNERILTIEDRVNVRHEPDGTTTVLETAHDANAPAWSPVDDRVAFWSGIENQYGQIWTINSDGTGSTQLTEDPTHRNNDDPSWSPDGKKILFSTGRSGRAELWTMDADGSNERKLSGIDAFPFPGRASWQPVKR